MRLLLSEGVCISYFDIVLCLSVFMHFAKMPSIFFLHFAYVLFPLLTVYNKNILHWISIFALKEARKLNNALLNCCWSYSQKSSDTLFQYVGTFLSLFCPWISIKLWHKEYFRLPLSLICAHEWIHGTLHSRGGHREKISSKSSTIFFRKILQNLSL